MDYRAMMRRKLLEQMYDRMTDDEKRLYVQMTMQERDHREIMQALNELSRKADKNHHSFALDLGANLAGNAAWDSLIWLGSKLIKKL